MATLGSTAEPTTNQTWYGLNSTNHFAILLTMPSGGPFEITRLGAWLAGQSESCNFKLCLWSSGGTLLRSSATMTAASMAFALGNNVKYEADITPYEVAGGQQVYVGFARDPNDNVQFGTRSGSMAQWFSSSWPVSFGSWSNVSSQIGAWIANYQDANSAPNAPVSLSPTGNTIVHSGTAPVVSGTRSDSDSGDYITAFQVLVYEDNGTSLIQDSGKVNLSGTSTTFGRTLALNGVNKYVKWKARTWDKKGVAGPYSALQRFWANAVPSTPGAPTVETATLTPDISGSFTDSGDTLAAVQIEVTLSASPYTSRWASGDIAKSGSSGSGWTQAYGGTALAWGTAYRARYRVKDSKGAYSSWSSWRTFTQAQPTGPSNMTPRTTNPRLASLTPTLTIGHSASFRNDEYQVNTNSAGTGTMMKSKTWTGTDYAGVTSKAYVYDGTALSYGVTYYWRSRIELVSDGTITAWSPWYPFRINATPNVPSGLTPTGGVASSTKPLLSWTFSDPDTDQGDSQSQYHIEIANNATGALVHTEDNNASSASAFTTAGVALVYGTTYKWRIKVTDAMGREGSFSSWQVFKYTQPPSALGDTPVAGAAVNDSTPTLDWTFSSPEGKTQKSFRVQIYDRGPVEAPFSDQEIVHDSGTVISSATQYDVPFGLLENGRAYYWTVTVTDTDGLSFTLTADLWESFDAMGDWHGYASNSTLSIDTVDKVQGSGSLKSVFNISASSAGGPERDLVPAIDWSAVLAIRVRIKVSTLTNLLRMLLVVRGPTTASYRTFVMTPTAAGVWEDKYIDLTVPYSESGVFDPFQVTQVQILAYATASAAYTGTINYDDFRIE